jgi:hypothetical protein
MGLCGDPPDACFNMMSDAGETDVDWGGDCVEDPNDPDNENGKCLPGESCLVGSDCTTELCVDGVCEVDPCGDMMQNNDETDVDCGQSCVADPNDPLNPDGKCDNGDGCLVDSDCVSNACDPNTLLCVDVCMNMEEDLAEVGGCCDAVTACLADVPKCVCWFNCISEPGSTVQACMDDCGNGNIGMIQSCVSNTCNQACN